jgi:hypothetical protein
MAASSRHLESFNKPPAVIPVIINMFRLVQVNNKRRYFNMIIQGYRDL